MTPSSRSRRTSAHMSRRRLTSTPAVGSSRNSTSGSWLSALAIITRRFMPPESSTMRAVALLPQREVAQQALDKGRIGRPAEQAAAERYGRRYGREDVERDLLRHQADAGAGGAKVAKDVEAGDADRARGHRHRAANHPDQRRLPGAVGAEQGEDLALVDGEIDRVEREISVAVTLGDGGAGDHGRHVGRSPGAARAASRDVPSRLYLGGPSAPVELGPRRPPPDPWEPIRMPQKPIGTKKQ